MNVNQIIAECAARKRENPDLTEQQIVNALMDEIGGYKEALRARPEFAVPDPESAD